MFGNISHRCYIQGNHQAVSRNEGHRAGSFGQHDVLPPRLSDYPVPEVFSRKEKTGSNAPTMPIRL
jgi:hypothetical protein